MAVKKQCREAARQRRFSRPTKYTPLIDYLTGLDASTVSLSMFEIEGILGFPLVTSAYVTATYWSSPRLLHVRSLGAAGWRACYRRERGSVEFTCMEQQ